MTSAPAGPADPANFKDFAVQGYNADTSVKVSKAADKTVVEVNLKEGGKTYTVTLSFNRQVGDDALREYLQSDATKSKINRYVDQYKVFDSHLNKSELVLTAQNNQTSISYTGKKGPRTHTIDDVLFSFENTKIYYQRKR